MSELVRDFDEGRRERTERPRSFKIGGEVFTFLRGMRPEEFHESTEDYFAMTPETPPMEAVAVMDETICAFLENKEEDTKRWAALRSRRSEAVTARDIREVLQMIFEEQTGHPTKLPEPSSNGDTSAGENSTESSSSEAEESEASVA